ncbi:MAG: hypothetical protein ACO1OB_03535 [Archangium sp.]
MKRALVLLLLSGCFNPDDLIPIRGTAPPGQHVELAREPFCFREMKTFAQTNAGDDGTFVFEVFRAQTQHLGNFSFQCLRARTRFTSGTRAEADLGSLESAAQLPPFIDWNPQLTFDGNTLQFAGLDAGAGFVTSHLTEMTSDDGGVSWRQSEILFGTKGLYRAPMHVDARVLREFSGTVRLQARYGETYEPSWVPSLVEATSVVAYAADALRVDFQDVPASRGAACDEVPASCPLTDGRLEAVRLPRDTKTLTIRFAAPFRPSLLVARDLLVFGDADQLPLSDGGVFLVPSMRVTGLTAAGEEIELTRHFFFIDTALDYSPLADGGLPIPGSHFVVPLDAGVPFTALRLRASSFQRVGEVSVF